MHKTLLTVISVFCICTMCQGGENGKARKWTDAKSEKTILGTIIDKKPDHSAALIRLSNGKEHWIKASRLTEDDQKFIREWEKPFQYLVFNIIRDEDETPQKLQVTLNANEEDIGLIAQPTKPAGGASFSFIKKSADAGESKTFEIPLDEEYKITIYNKSGGKLHEVIRKPVESK